jgi:type VI secretion system protein ImpG
MDDRLFSLYEQELKHLRETLVEFGEAFPTPGRELALKANPADPYVERLLDGVAFLAARVRLKLDARFPQFTQSLLETIYPDFLAPMPSQAVVRLRPDSANPPPPGGSVVRRGSTLRGKPRELGESQRGA